MCHIPVRNNTDVSNVTPPYCLLPDKQAKGCMFLGGPPIGPQYFKDGPLASFHLRLFCNAFELELLIWRAGERRPRMNQWWQWKCIGWSCGRAVGLPTCVAGRSSDDLHWKGSTTQCVRTSPTDVVRMSIPEGNRVGCVDLSSVLNTQYMNGMSIVRSIGLSIGGSVFGLNDHTKHGSGLLEVHYCPSLDSGGMDEHQWCVSSKDLSLGEDRIDSYHKPSAHLPKSFLSHVNIFYLSLSWHSNLRHSSLHKYGYILNDSEVSLIRCFHIMAVKWHHHIRRFWSLIETFSKCQSVASFYFLLVHSPPFLDMFSVRELVSFLQGFGV